MKKFIIKLTLFSLIVAIITISVNFLFVLLDRNDADYTNKFDSIPNKVTICNFGSSHGLYGFNYVDLEDDQFSCFNFSLSAQYLTYDFRLIQQYRDCIDDETVVFIPVSYFSLFGKDEIFEDNFISKNKRYYSILSPKLIKDYDMVTDIYVNYLPALGVDTSELIRTLLGKSTNDEQDSMWLKVASDIDVSAAAKITYSVHIKEGKFDDNGNRILNQQEVDALYDLIYFCRDKGATPILVTTPYLSEYTDEIKRSDPDFYDDFYNVLSGVIKKTDVDFYDYAFDERFIHNYDWFMDSDHLNKEGARQFTNILFEEAVSKKYY